MKELSNRNLENLAAFLERCDGLALPAPVNAALDPARQLNNQLKKVGSFVFTGIQEYADAMTCEVSAEVVLVSCSWGQFLPQGLVR